MLVPKHRQPVELESSKRLVNETRAINKRILLQIIKNKNRIVNCFIESNACCVRYKRNFNMFSHADSNDYQLQL